MIGRSITSGRVAPTPEQVAADLGRRADRMLDMMKDGRTEDGNGHTAGDRIAYITTAVAAATAFGTAEIHDAAEAFEKTGGLPADVDPALAAAIRTAAVRLPT